MNVLPGTTYQAVPLGGLGTGCLEFCDDGRFRNLSINNNRTAGRAIPLARHSFLAVRASSDEDIYLRRLQTPLDDGRDLYLLPPGGLQFRGLYPQADFNVIDSSAPLEMAFGAYAPVIPYDYEASSLPLIFIAAQVTNKTAAPLEVSVVLNWQNTCGQYGAEPPELLRPVSRELLITEEDWEQAKGNEGGDNERRLHADTGLVVQTHDNVFSREEIPPNALVFSDHRELDQNEDGEYCVVSRWKNDTHISQMVWDPESPGDQDRFWEQLAKTGTFNSSQADATVPRCGALCAKFSLAAGESRTVEFIVSWHGARYEVDGADLGNFYTNAHPHAVAVAKTGLLNGSYYHASVEAWRQRLSTAGFPQDLVKHVVAHSNVLSTNTLHGRDGAFGLLQGASDPRVNSIRDRWNWSMALLLLYPRLETESMERISQAAIAEDGQRLAISEGLERLCSPEYAGLGAAQVEAGANLVACTYRNYLFTGNLSAIAQLVPRMQQIMALLLTQDKNVDGFPDIQGEESELDGGFASGLNVITAGIWLVALHACEAMIRMGRMPATPLYRQARKLATQNFDRYFWNEEHGYYTLYPAARYELGSAHLLNQACHVGQLTAVWMADVLGLGSIIASSRLPRVLATLKTHNVRPGGFRTISWPAGDDGGTSQPVSTADNIYGIVAYACVRLHRELFQHVYEGIAPLLDEYLTGETHALGPTVPQDTASDSQRHVGRLALWYLLVASPAVQMRLAEKCIVVSPDRRHDEESREHFLITPRGFGRVHVLVRREKPFRCAIKFEMDVPLELTSIRIHLDQNPGNVAGTFDLPEGAAPMRITTESVCDDGVVLRINPAVKSPLSSFELRLEETKTSPDGESSKKRWIPHWLRRPDA